MLYALAREACRAGSWHFLPCSGTHRGQKTTGQRESMRASIVHRASLATKRPTVALMKRSSNKSDTGQVSYLRREWSASKGSPAQRAPAWRLACWQNGASAGWQGSC